jgi:hypothetical protein
VRGAAASLWHFLIRLELAQVACHSDFLAKTPADDDFRREFAKSATVN